MKRLPAVDVVIVGGGWAGLLMAKELGSRTPLSVVVLERGETRTASAAEYLNDMDELDYAVRGRLMQDDSLETVTFRHALGDHALPLRQLRCFLPGTGVGGAGEHWDGTSDRHLPDCFEVFSKTVEKHAAKSLPPDCSIQDWGVTYDELEPYYTRAEQLMGVSGQAGNVRGKRIEGGNIFEGRRSAGYPTPPIKIPYFSALFRSATESLGYHPYPSPCATLSEPFTNPDGVARPGCTYCGFCSRYGCMIGSKAQPTSVLLPVIQKHKNVSIRAGAQVRRISHDGGHNKGQAGGVVYSDASGEEIFQPADLVILASWTLSNTRLLLLSGVAEPYNPLTGKGNVGRNLTHQVGAAVTLFFEKPLNRFMGTGSAAVFMSDFNGDLFDHAGLHFVRGGLLEAPSHGYAPIENFGLLPRSVKTAWGADWKKAGIHYYDRTGHITFSGEHLAYKDNYMDLDPTYRDHWGDPLLRLTLDWRENERQMTAFAGVKLVEIARAMKAKEITPFSPLGHYDTRRYHSTHVQGGTIMGASPENSVVNPYLQHWQLANLFILGGSTFPQNAATHPTLTILAQTIRTADALVERFLKHPGPLA
ncbi:MAG: GMC family oxidoreductase [Terriglobia bacterium]